ncbi:FAD-dependent oxidoreductase [Nanoarchaeota archaeon]
MVKVLEGKLSKITKFSPTVKFFEFDLGEVFDFLPGQFVMVEKDGVKRAYSLASQPGKKTIELCVTIVSGGKLTTKLDDMPLGGKVKVTGPYSMYGRDILKMDNDVIFIATGSGVTPMRCLLNYLLNNNFKHKITLIFGFRYEEDFLFKAEFKQLAEKHDNFDLVITASQPKELKTWGKSVGRVTKIIDQYVDDKSDYFICGLNNMVSDVKRILVEKGVEKERIHAESW